MLMAPPRPARASGVRAEVLIAATLLLVLSALFMMRAGAADDGARRAAGVQQKANIAGELETAIDLYLLGDS